MANPWDNDPVVGGNTTTPAESSVIYGAASKPAFDLAAALAQTDKMLSLPEGFSTAQIQVESGGNPKARSPAGAMGLAQVMPKTLAVVSKRLGRELDPDNEKDAVDIHREVMRENLAKFKTPDKALMAYNGGWDESKWGNPETSAYVGRVSKAMKGQGSVMAAAGKAVNAVMPSAQAAQANPWDNDPVVEEPSAPPNKETPGLSKDYQSGRDAPGWKQGLASVVNGPLMGFGDEVLGGLGAMIDKAKNPSSDLSANYTANRDTVRGMQDAQTEENPWTTGITQAMAAAPMLVLNPLGKLASGAVSALPQAMRATGAAPAVTGMLPNAVRAAGTGLGYGGVQGAGDSRADTLNGVMADAATTGLTSAALSGVASPVAAVLGAGAKNIGQRFSKTQAGEAAKQKIAEALARDARGEVFTSGQSNPITQVQKRFDRLGAEATLADAGGRNTNQLLDTLATLPGRTKDAAEQLIHTRQAGRAGRLVTAAEDGLSTQGQRLSPNLMQWIDDRQMSSAPLYEQLRQTSITPSSKLQALVASADELGAVKLGREMATARQQPFSLDAAPSPRNGVTNQPGSQTWTMGDLDHVKQGLDQKIAKQWDAAAGKLTPLGAAYQDLKTKLVGELDTATFDAGTGSSLYKSARDAFSGPSALIDASQQGKLALNKDGVSIAGMLSPMSASEQQAFRLGAFEALRNKLGREAGQTEILKMWKEPATREKLASIFGDQANFRRFSADVAKEARLKGLESAGRGSQTAARQYGAGDLDQAALAEAGAAVGAAKTGNIIGAIGAAKSAWSRVATPQTVRDEMGGMLLSKGSTGRQGIDSLSGLVQRINDQNAMVSQGIGAAGSQIGSRLAPPMRTQPLASSEARAPGGAQASFADAPVGVNVRMNQPDAPFTVAPQQDGNPPADMAPAAIPNGTREEGAMVAPEFDTLAQAGGMPAQDAAPAFTSSLRPDGTLAVKGDAQALRATLAASGIPARSMVPINGGLLIGRSQAGKVQEAIDRMQAPSAMPQDVMANADTAAPGAQTAEQVIAQAPKFDPETAGADGEGLPPLEQPTAMGAPGAGPETAQGFASNVPEAREQQAQAATNSGVESQQPGNTWAAFPPDSGSLGVPREAMPQIKADQHIALVDFLRARGVGAQQGEVDPGALKPTQAEFSPEKVDKAAAFASDSRPILISADGHVVDGHHQWLSKLQSGDPVSAIQLGAPIQDLLPMVGAFPGATQSDGGLQAGAISDGGEQIAQAQQPGVMSNQGSHQSAGTLQPEAMQSAQTGAAPTQPEAMAMGEPVQSTQELARIQRLRDSGENKVADILQRRQTLGVVQTELASMQAATPDLQHHASPAFSQHYQQRRLAGMKPAEASAHAGMLAAVQSAAPQIGMPDMAIKALAAKLPDIPIDEAPGFIERYTLALIKRGIVQPFEGSNQIADMVEQARDSAMNGALDSLYGAHNS